jgi:hypothetical protein
MTTEIDFDALVPRLRVKEAIHPESTIPFSESKKPLNTTTPLTERTPIVVFAWEFLRRNRFYQALVDERKDALPASEWGFRSHPLQPKTHGLSVLKPYWEEYDQGDLPNWIGLDTFAKRTEMMISDKPQEVTIQLLPGQVAVIFDTYGLLNGRSPVEIQTDAASFYLAQLAEKQYQIKTIKNKSVHRSVLIRRWELMLLLIDEGKPLTRAAEHLKYPTKTLNVNKKRGAPSFGHELVKKSKEPVTTAYEDADFVYRCMYRHGYMDLLARKESYVIEDGRLVPFVRSVTMEAMIEEAMDGYEGS